jgi:hypothetical protein
MQKKKIKMLIQLINETFQPLKNEFFFKKNNSSLVNIKL